MKDLALAILDLALVLLDLPRPHIVLVDHRLVSQLLTVHLVLFQLVFLRDQLLSGFTEHALIVSLVLVHVLVLHSDGGRCPEDLVSLTETIASLHSIPVLLLAHRRI